MLLLLLQVAAWLKTLPSAKSPLVAMTAQQASDAAVDRLQMQLPPLLPVGTGALGECKLLLLLQLKRLCLLRMCSPNTPNLCCAALHTDAVCRLPCMCAVVVVIRV
jgi:hypothetical protein